jgi:hypothetical protein
MRSILRLVVSSVLALVFLTGTSVLAEPSPTNRIGLRVARVYLAKEAGFDLTTEAGTNRYEYFVQPLKLDDEIRYAWFGTNLNVANVAAPSFGNGYLKVYLGDDSKEDNLIRTYGSSPLPVRDIANKLVPGRNKILMVLVENPQGTADPATKVEFNFDYQPDTLPASIEVIAPTPGSVFASGITRDFTIKLNNFFLEKDNSNQTNRGKLEVYANDITGDTLLNTFTSSVNKDSYSEVSFTTNDLEKLQQIPDNAKSKLIFVLKTSAGKEIESARKELAIATNYGGTVDLGLPTIKIVDPANNAEVTASTKIKLEVKNFDLLAGLDTNNQKAGTGYIQLRINDRVVIENTNKTEFSLQDFGLTNFSGVINLRADLVNQQFAFLQPSASAAVSLVVKKDSTATTTNNLTVTNSSWRYVVLAATILLILGSIAVLIIKG